MKLQGRRLPDKQYVKMPGGLKRWVSRFGLGAFHFVFKTADGRQVNARGSIVGEEFVFIDARDRKLWIESRKKVETRNSYLLKGSTWSQDRYDARASGEIAMDKAVIDSEGRVIRK